MNPVLSKLAAAMQIAAGIYIPKAYLIGKRKVEQQYGIVRPWCDRDQASIQLLLTRHAQELQGAMVGAELAINQGAELAEVIDGFISRVSAWAWVLSPALAMGTSEAITQNRAEISEAEELEPNNIGIIWYTAEDERVCPRCLYLAGRWFDADNAYDIASRVHPNCRCPAHFDIGQPFEALVGPIQGYKPGTAQDIYRDLHISELIRARRQRANIFTNRPARGARPDVRM